MSKGITFEDYKEARDYQEDLLRQGINSHLEKRQGAYIVLPKEKTKIIMEQVERKSLGDWGKAAYEYDPDEPTVWYTKGASTRAKLHEIGHAIMKHTATQDLHQEASDEIDADIYSYTKMCKPLNCTVGHSAMSALLRLGETPQKAAEIVQDELRKRNIDSTQEELIRLVEG